MLPGSVYFEARYTFRQAESTQKAEARRKKEAEAQAAKQQAESTQKAEARRKKEADAQAAKQQAESTQETDARRKKEAEAQVAKRQSRKQRQGERELPRSRQLSANLDPTSHSYTLYIIKQRGVCLH